MTRTVLIALLAFVCLITGLATFNGSALLLALPLLLYLAFGLWAGPGEVRLAIGRTLDRDHVTAGDPVVVTVTVRNHGRPLAELLLADDVPPGLAVIDGRPELLAALPAGGTLTLRYTVSGPRGAYRFARVSARAADPFDLVRRVRRYDVPGDLLCVYVPQRRLLRHIPIQPRRTRVYAGSIAARAGGDGIDFYGVRRFGTGDDPRRINWRASSRPDEQLFTNQYQQERVADVGLILDARRVSNLTAGGADLLEHGVAAAAALAELFLSQGNRVALLIYGDAIDFTLPGYGKVQRERLLRALARARPGASQVFAELTYLPTRLFPAQSQIVLITPLRDGDVPFLHRLRAIGYELLVVAPNPVAFERRHLPATAAAALAVDLAQRERRLLLRQLAQAGIGLLDWDVAQPFDDAAAAQLHQATVRRRMWQARA